MPLLNRYYTAANIGYTFNLACLANMLSSERKVDLKNENSEFLSKISIISSVIKRVPRAFNLLSSYNWSC